MENYEIEKLLIQLENVVKTLENGDLSLNESMKLYEEGHKLSKLCQTILNDAKQKITVIHNDFYAENEFETLESMEENNEL